MLDNLSYNCFKNKKFSISITETKSMQNIQKNIEKSEPFVGLNDISDKNKRK